MPPRQYSPKHSSGLSRGRHRRPARLTVEVAATAATALAGTAVALTFGIGPAVGVAGQGRDLVPPPHPAAARSTQPRPSAQRSQTAAAATPATARRRPAADGRSARPARRAPSARPMPARSGPPPPAGSAPAGQASALAGHTEPYLIYDSATPTAIPAGQIVATYADGPHPVSPAEVAGRSQVLWIDITGADPAATVLDVEPGCAAPSVAAGWVQRRLRSQPGGVAIIYTMLSEWPTVQAAVAWLPDSARSRIRWWIADPTGFAHIVPGSQATQWYWGSGYDISSALPDF